MRSSKDVAGFVNLHYGCRPQEHFLSLFLSSASEIIGVQEISMGSLASTEVDPRVVFAGALASGAPSIIICHNHPSGSIEPSQADVHLTQQLVNGGRLLAIKVLDHVIVGRGGGHFSFAENDRMPK
jgi:DNA repair protein RadC